VPDKINNTRIFLYLAGDQIQKTSSNASFMESNEKLRKEIFSVIKNQIKENNPPETRATYNRLRKQGFDDFTTMQMLGQCLAVEIFEMLKYKKPYDRDRYIRHLLGLPEQPFE